MNTHIHFQVPLGELDVLLFGLRNDLPRVQLRYLSLNKRLVCLLSTPQTNKSNTRHMRNDREKGLLHPLILNNDFDSTGNIECERQG
jgi:hypothetical protein